ncbi:thymidylate synthase [Croceicoccus sp. F390]|uniref:Thymidylate synthase n=1 Tax=Croceicoccus esteveae TaxID=3075597 RepID=A0ABU2ZNB1_9SPHN|nr:thymidylate synthase [Croceicoccus sp. F390]MDT0576917.1 thymidylate synthase [Croceicoccus sp. F390]
MAFITPAADRTAPDHFEWQYLDLMHRIWTAGDERHDRTGVGTRSLFGETLRFDLADGAMPLITTKRVFWKTATRELLWFLTGETNIRPLVQQGVAIWTDWPLARYRRETAHDITKDDFVSRIIDDVEFARRWGDLGPVYGRQWVNWPSFVATGDGLYRKGEGINQIAKLVEGLRKDPYGRRHILEGWNVAELDAMALPPCHKTYQFHVAAGRLNSLLSQRSCDVALGLPFNLWSAALLQRMIAAQVGLKPGIFMWVGGDTHLYLNHDRLVEEQLRRQPDGHPRLTINSEVDDIFAYSLQDFTVHDYAPQPQITAPVAV